MARDIVNDLTNTDPVDGVNPYGTIKDESVSGSNNGTVVNEAMLADVVVLFQKLMDEAGIAPNNLPDNITNGFQLFESLKKATGFEQIVIEIGDWDMVSNATLVVNHSLANINKIRGISVIVRDDTDSFIYDLSGFDVNDVNSGGVQIVTPTNITLRRNPSSFNTTSFDSTSYNRGWITIQYEL